MASVRSLTACLRSAGAFSIHVSSLEKTVSISWISPVDSLDESIRYFSRCQPFTASICLPTNVSRSLDDSSSTNSIALNTIQLSSSFQALACNCCSCSPVIASGSDVFTEPLLSASASRSTSFALDWKLNVPRSLVQSQNCTPWCIALVNRLESFGSGSVVAQWSSLSNNAKKMVLMV